NEGHRSLVDLILIISQSLVGGCRRTPRQFSLRFEPIVKVPTIPATAGFVTFVGPAGDPIVVGFARAAGLLVLCVGIGSSPFLVSVCHRLFTSSNGWMHDRFRTRDY